MPDDGIQQTLGDGNVEPVELQEEMERSFLEYAMSVITARALPDARDGLKPVHRRILRLRLDRRDALEAVPQRMQIGRFELRDERRRPVMAARLPNRDDIRHRMLALALRQLRVDILAVDKLVLDEHARLDLVALEILREHVDAEPAPQHRIELDGHGDIAVLHRPQPGRRGGDGEAGDGLPRADRGGRARHADPA